jgi:hypothetical protein
MFICTCIHVSKNAMFVRFEVFTAVTMKNAVFWDVAPYRSHVNRRFREKYRLHLQGSKIRAHEEPMWAGSHKIYTAPHPRRQHSSTQCMSIQAVLHKYVTWQQSPSCTTNATSKFVSNSHSYSCTLFPPFQSNGMQWDVCFLLSFITECFVHVLFLSI